MKQPFFMYRNLETRLKASIYTGIYIWRGMGQLWLLYAQSDVTGKRRGTSAKM